MPPVTPEDLLPRLLRRLPPSLWDTDPASPTVQRDLYAAVATLEASWLAQREVARTMTLLLEAAGVDLDVLLADYGLKRYLQRPDAYARQVGERILFAPQGTQYSVAQLADLLLDMPHTTLRTGPGQVHVFVASSQPITTPYSYWGLVSQQGQWYAVTVAAEVATISPIPPPGLNVAPGPQTLHWFTVWDAAEDPWYVTIDGDVLAISQTQPSGTGTEEPFGVLDGQGNLWRLSVDAPSQVLVTSIDPGLSSFGYWRFVDPLGTIYALWIEAGVVTISTTAPAGSDQTPGGAPLAWAVLLDEAAQSWYLSLEHGVVLLQPTAPGVLGTTEPLVLLDATRTRWVLEVDRAGTLVATPTLPTNADLVVVAPDAPFQALQLVDSAGTGWWLTVEAAVFSLTLACPAGAQDVTPPGGPFHWLRMVDMAGGRWYAFPDPTGVLVLEATAPEMPGTQTPTTLGDAQGILWHWGVSTGGTIGLSSAPPVDSGDYATAICLFDALGQGWFWRVDGAVLEWSPVLWPDTFDASPWGSLGWLQVTNEAGVPTYVYPNPQGDSTAALAPPGHALGGWQAPVTFVDLQGTSWRLLVQPDGRTGVTPLMQEDIPAAQTRVDLPELHEALGHVQAAGSLVTVLVQ